MEVISFFVAQSQILLHIVGLGASPVFIQSIALVGIAIGVVVGVTAIAYFGFRLLNAIFTPAQEQGKQDEAEPVAPLGSPARKAKPSRKAKTQKSLSRIPDNEIPKQYKILQESNYWFTQTNFLWYMEYLNSKDSRLFIFDIDSLQKKGMHYRDILSRRTRICTISKVNARACPINEEILFDFKNATPQNTIFAYPLRLSGNHWTLVLVDKKKRTIEFYDSRKNYPDEYTDASGSVHYSDINAHFKKFAKKLTKQDPGKPYIFVHKTNTYLATNDDDCGPWVVYFLEKRLENPDIDFNQLNPMPNMQKYRFEIAQNLAIAEKEKSAPQAEIPDSQNKKPRKKRAI